MSSYFPASDDSEKTQIAPRKAAAPMPAGLDVREISSLSAANPLLAAANPLLMMLQSLRSAQAPGNVNELRVRLIDAVKEFEAACDRARVPELERRIANYALCTVVDEAVQMTPWGGAANWAQQSLLIHYHRESQGGEKFFEFLNRIAGSPGQYGSLLELFYVCLSLGFMGRFHLEGPAGRQAVNDLRERIHTLMRQGRPATDTTLSSQWAGLQVARRQFRGFGLVGAAVALMALLCLGLFSYYWFALGSQFEALEFHKLALKRQPPAAIAIEASAKPRLAQLLAEEVKSRQLEVRDLKLESVVTILGERMFEVGSVTPSSAAGQLLGKVADALKSVEGKVVVIGHTDNLPIRTLRFASNQALSRERADNVARMLGDRLGDAGRVASEGRGDESPIASNDTAEGRSQNRRVEIVLKSVDAVR